MVQANVIRIWPLHVFLLQFLESTSLLPGCLYNGSSRFYIVWFKPKKKEKKKPPPSPTPSPQLLFLALSSKSPAISFDWLWLVIDHSQANHWVQEEVVLWGAKLESHGQSWSWNTDGSKLTTGMESGGGIIPQRKFRTLTHREGGLDAVKANPTNVYYTGEEQGETHTDYCNYRLQITVVINT